MQSNSEKPYTSRSWNRKLPETGEGGPMSMPTDRPVYLPQLPPLKAKASPSPRTWPRVWSDNDFLAAREDPTCLAVSARTRWVLRGSGRGCRHSRFGAYYQAWCPAVSKVGWSNDNGQATQAAGEAIVVRLVLVMAPCLAEALLVKVEACDGRPAMQWF